MARECFWGDNLLSPEDILAGLEQDDPKDVFELYTVYWHQPVQWPLVFEDAANTLLIRKCSCFV